MLARVIRPDGEAVTFAYDPLGRRISKTYQGKTTRWVWDGNVPLHEWVEEATDVLVADAKTVPDANADVIQSARQAKIAPISAQGPPEPKLTTWLFEPESFAPMAKIVDGQSYSIITDHLGTPFEMYDSAGMRTWAAELDIYGAVRVVQEGTAVDCPFRYPGQYEDEETGLYYNRFRYYDPEAGAYVSQDPIGLAGGNPTLYGYVGDPLAWVDELGLACSKKQTRNPKDVERLRKNFDKSGGAKQRYLKSLVKTKKQRAEMKKHFGDEGVERMINGKVPEGFAVHHKTPLFRGGTNRRSNFSIIDDDVHKENSKLLHYYDSDVNPIDSGIFKDFII